MNHFGKWRMVIGADSAGLEFKEQIRNDLLADPRVSEIVDVSALLDKDTDYPTIALDAAERIRAGLADRAVLICGTGLGVAISANKVPGIRAVTISDSYSLERSVLSNDAQVLCLGQRVIGLELARHLVNEWLDLVFDPKAKSSSKLATLARYEQGIEAATDNFR